MPSELIRFIAEYGYLAIFILVILQELGFPNPVPNEFILIFVGYLVFTGALSMVSVLITAISADVTGSQILYSVFYFAGNYLISRKPKWLPEKKIERLKERITKGGKVAIFIGRVTPLLRGYTAVLVGLLQITPKVFIPMVILSAIVYNGMYIFLGYIMGPYWESIANKMGGIRFVTLLIILMVLFTFLIKAIIHGKSNSKERK
jgi:membrane protein DedA with SNARE-associated domain